jgi:hypothetical protein
MRLEPPVRSSSTVPSLGIGVGSRRRRFEGRGTRRDGSGGGSERCQNCTESCDSEFEMNLEKFHHHLDASKRNYHHLDACKRVHHHH